MTRVLHNGMPAMTLKEMHKRLTAIIDESPDLANNPMVLRMERGGRKTDHYYTVRYVGGSALIIGDNGHFVAMYTDAEQRFTCAEDIRPYMHVVPPFNKDGGGS